MLRLHHSDELVAAAVDGPTSFGDVTYQTTYQTVTGLLPVGSEGINYGTSTCVINVVLYAEP